MMTDADADRIIAQAKTLSETLRRTKIVVTTDNIDVLERLIGPLVVLRNQLERKLEQIERA